MVHSDISIKILKYEKSGSASALYHLAVRVTTLCFLRQGHLGLLLCELIEIRSFRALGALVCPSSPQVLSEDGGVLIVGVFEQSTSNSLAPADFIVASAVAEVVQRKPESSH